MNPTPLAVKKEWKPTHKMTRYEYDSAIDLLEMFLEYEVIGMDRYMELRGRIDRMVDE